MYVNYVTFIVPTYNSFGKHQSQVRVDQYEKLIQSIENCFVDGMPLHSSNTKSMFYVISEGQLAAHKLQEIHQIHGKQHILITEMATSHLTFDEYGLETLKSVEAVIDIYSEHPHSFSPLVEFDGFWYRFLPQFRW